MEEKPRTFHRHLGTTDPSPDRSLGRSLSSLTVQDTEKLLVRDGAADGWFLVRQSTKEKNVFVISLCFKGRLFHNQV